MRKSFFFNLLLLSVLVCFYITQLLNRLLRARLEFVRQFENSTGLAVSEQQNRLTNGRSFCAKSARKIDRVIYVLFVL